MTRGARDFFTAGEAIGFFEAERVPERTCVEGQTGVKVRVAPVDAAREAPPGIGREFCALVGG